MKKIIFKAAHNMAISYTSLKDYDNAIKWYEIAISKGITESYINLGLLYDVTLKDKEKAMKYYMLDIALGSFQAVKKYG